MKLLAIFESLKGGIIRFEVHYRGGKGGMTPKRIDQLGGGIYKIKL